MGQAAFDSPDGRWTPRYRLQYRPPLFALSFVTHLIPSMKILFAATLVLCWSVPLSTTQALAQGSAQGRSTGVAVSPLQIRKTVQAGNVTKDNILIQSLEEVPMRVSVRIQSVLFEDWTYLPQFGARHSRDAFPWFATNIITRDLRPFDKLEVPIDATVPRTTRGRTSVYWAMATVDLSVPSQPTRILPSFQIPLIYLVGARPIRPEVTIGSPELLAGKTGATTYLPFINDSAGYTPISAFITVRNMATGRIITTMQEAGRNLYPESRRKLTFSLGHLAPGQYSVSARAEIGTRRLPAVTSNFTVTETEARQLTTADTFSIAPVAIDPPLINETLVPGARRSVPIKITNTSANAIAVSIAPRLLTQATTGALEVSETAPPKGATLYATPDSVVIGPRQTANVRLVLEVAPGATGETCFGVAVQDINAKTSFSGITVAVLTVKGTLAPKLSLVPGALRRNNGDPYSLEFSILNTGNQALQPNVTAGLFDNGGTRFMTGINLPILGDGSILPGATLENKVAIPPKLKPGNYVVEVDYQYGPDLKATMRVPFKVANHPSK